MFLQSCAFLLGVVFALYSKQWFITAVCINLSCFVLMFQKKILKKYQSEYIGITLAFVIGFFWCCYQYTGIIKTLPRQYVGKTVCVTGTVESIPQLKKNTLQFEYLIHSIDRIPQKPIRVLISYYRAVQNPLLIQLGETWTLNVRLKQPRGFWNPGSFDYEAWLLQRRIQWVGTIVPTAQSFEHVNKKNNHEVKQQLIISKLRRFYHHILQNIDNTRMKINTEINLTLENQEKFLIGLIESLVTGKRDAILEKSWLTMRATGTNHLFAISGLHIGLIAGILYKLTEWISKLLLPLILYIPAPQVSALVGWLGALVYSALSGMALPAQRAMIMTSVVTFSYLKRRPFLIWQNWSTALLLILIYDPLVVLSESFWLSFSAVGIIFYGTGGRLYFRGQQNHRLRNFWKRWGQTQWIVSVGLLPMTILFFKQIAFLSFFINLIAIPWIGFLVVPFCVAGGLMYLIQPTLGHLLLLFGAKSVSIFWKGLEYIEQLPIAHSVANISHVWIFLSTVLGVFLFLGPKKFPGRFYFSAILFTPVLLYKPLAPKEQEFWITLLDVGQGLAAVIRTKNHVLIYDTGPKLGLSSDTGKTVVLPYLNTMNIRSIDKLIISHGDSDHSGGLHSVLKGMHVKSLISSQPERLNTPLAKFCYNGQTWNWDGVQFEIMHPPLNNRLKSNDRSCVLRVNNHLCSVLLPGDIHRKGEKILLRNHFNLKSTVLISPHHGSKTSSSIAFIKAVQPRYALFPVGLHNRFGFPHASVVLRYAQENCAMYSTAQKGAITMKFGTTEEEICLENYYDCTKRFWHQPVEEIVGVAMQKNLNKKIRKYQHTKKTCQQIIEHNAQSSFNMPVDPTDRKGFVNIKKSKQ